VARGVELIKVHGSLNWTFHFFPATADGGVPPHRFVITWGDEAPDYSRPELAPGIVFGGENKLIAEGPFLEIFQRFRNELLSATRLTVVGYSFRDEHVNEQIATFALRRPESKIFIID
jgi:hypothetical protein